MNEAAQAVFIQETIVAYFPEAYPTMLAIAYCETRARPFVHWEPDGSLRPNLGGNSSAAGALQVLLYLHRDAIAAQELDMRDIDDYMQFVRYLYDTGGYPFSPWEESRHCWGHRIGDFTADVAHPTS